MKEHANAHQLASPDSPAPPLTCCSPIQPLPPASPSQSTLLKINLVGLNTSCHLQQHLNQHCLKLAKLSSTIIVFYPNTDYIKRHIEINIKMSHSLVFSMSQHKKPNVN